jgi:hypothetical protein
MIKILDFYPEFAHSKGKCQMTITSKLNWAKGLYGGRSQDRTVDLLLVRQAL